MTFMTFKESPRYLGYLGYLGYLSDGGMVRGSGNEQASNFPVAVSLIVDTPIIACPYAVQLFLKSDRHQTCWLAAEYALTMEHAAMAGPCSVPVLSMAHQR